MSLLPIERTFCHIQGIGKNTEDLLWKVGITSWADAMEYQGSDISTLTMKRVKENCEISTQRLVEEDWDYFLKTLPANEQWRVFGSLSGSVAYIDIETTGVRIQSTSVTIIGLFDGETVYVYMNDFSDLQEKPPIKTGKHKVVLAPGHKFEEKMAEVKKIVTFNGKSFDVPILKKFFCDVDFNLPHLDLRVAFRSIGRRGGLKRLESELGIVRPEGVLGLSGGDAVGLWAQYKMANDLDALATLIEYNIQDIVNLEELSKIFFSRRLNHFPRNTRVIL